MNRLEANARLVRRCVDELWNQGRLELLDELIAPDYINHNPGLPDPPPGPAGLRPIIVAVREAIPDLLVRIDDMVVAEDKVALRATVTGTQVGPLFGLPATGRRCSIAQFQIERIEQGRIVEHWRLSDDLSTLRQLGLLPVRSRR